MAKKREGAPEMHVGPVQHDNSIYEGNSTRVFQDECEIRLGSGKKLVGVFTASGGIGFIRRLQLLWNKSRDLTDEQLEAAEFLADMRPRQA